MTKSLHRTGWATTARATVTSSNEPLNRSGSVSTLMAAATGA